MAPQYGIWYSTQGAKGQKPEGPLAQAQELFNQFKATIDPARQVDLGKQIVQLAHQNLWTIETVGALPSIPVIKNAMANVPDMAVTDWIYMSPGNLDPAQFYFKA
jgi:peptide/nickel transport system substrate-binding protein